MGDDRMQQAHSTCLSGSLLDNQHDYNSLQTTRSTIVGSSYKLRATNTAVLQEVIDQRHQVSNRLHGVLNHLVRSDMTCMLNAWREVVLLQQLARMALAKHNAGTRTRYD